MRSDSKKALLLLVPTLSTSKEKTPESTKLGFRRCSFCFVVSSIDASSGVGIRTLDTRIMIPLL